jgi:hypothetical protein
MEEAPRSAHPQASEPAAAPSLAIKRDTTIAACITGRGRRRRRQTPVQKDPGLGIPAETPDPGIPIPTDPLPETERSPARQGRGWRNLFHSGDDAAASPSPPGNSNLGHLGPKLPIRTKIDGLPHLPTTQRPPEARKTAFSAGTADCN